MQSNEMPDYLSVATCVKLQTRVLLMIGTRPGPAPVTNEIPDYILFNWFTTTAALAVHVVRCLHKFLNIGSKLALNIGSKFLNIGSKLGSKLTLGRGWQNSGSPRRAEKLYLFLTVHSRIGSIILNRRAGQCIKCLTGLRVCKGPVGGFVAFIKICVSPASP